MTRFFNCHANKLQGQAEKFQSLKVTKQYTEDELLLLLENMFEGKFMQINEMVAPHSYLYFDQGYVWQKIFDIKILRKKL